MTGLLSITLKIHLALAERNSSPKMWGTGKEMIQNWTVIGSHTLSESGITEMITLSKERPVKKSFKTLKKLSKLVPKRDSEEFPRSKTAKGGKPSLSKKSKRRRKLKAFPKPKVESAADKAIGGAKVRVHPSTGKINQPRIKHDEESAKRSYAQNQEVQAYNRHRDSASQRDIAPLPTKQIDWVRRLRSKEDFLFDAKEYHGTTFKLEFGEAHQIVARKIAQCCTQQTYYALAMPRGSGKTSFCRTGVLWAIKHCFKRFAINVGTAEDKAMQTLKYIQHNLTSNAKLVQDFPEVAYPVYHMMSQCGRFSPSQLFNGQKTHLDVKSDVISLANVLLTEEEAKPYLDNDPDSIQFLEEHGAYLPRACGAIIKSVGISGGLRGDAIIHPVTLETMRPDLILLDDIQKDIDAKNPDVVTKMCELVDGAIANMEGPDVALSILFPGTVMQEGDVMCRYLDHTLHPEYQGEICKMVMQWPEGMSDEEISKESKVGMLWIQYQQIRIESLNVYHNVSLATEFYKQNREDMDEGFIVSWPDRYPRNKGIVSAIQQAMELRFTNFSIFLAEQQQKGKPLYADVLSVLPPERFAAKQHGYPRNIAPVGTELCAVVDIQEEYFLYGVIAYTLGMTPYVIDYDTFPKIQLKWFIKREANSWKMLTDAFYEAYPERRKGWMDSVGKKSANRDARIYHGLGLVTSYLAQRVYQRAEGGTPLRISKIGMDVRGSDANIIKQFCREWSSGPIKIGKGDAIIRAEDLIIPMRGDYISPAARQFEDYTPTKGWVFENDKHHHIEEPKWVWRPDPGTAQYILRFDSNRCKTFLHQRIEAAPGTLGALSLYSSEDKTEHNLLSQHICNSEYPIVHTVGGKSKIEWKERDHKPDNDYLDIFSNCLTLASFLGASIKIKEEATDSSVGETEPKETRTFQEIWNEKRNQRTKG